MLGSLTSSLVRVFLFWYLLGLSVFFLGDPAWAERAWQWLSFYPHTPALELKGIHSAFTVQWHLLLYWTVPAVLLTITAVAAGATFSAFQYFMKERNTAQAVKAEGSFWGVYIPDFSFGKIPPATVPRLAGRRLALPGGTGTPIQMSAQLTAICQWMTPAERGLCEDILQLLCADPDHYAGQGHGVGLLEHTLNVVAEVAPRCTQDFRLPLVAAFAHDVGKLLTFVPDGKGGWFRKGWHTREGMRIIATLPSFQALDQLTREALLLVVKYEHSPKHMPILRGKVESQQLALRIFSALAKADQQATAAEKNRHLDKLQPEDLLWLDFVTNLREAPVVQRGKPGVVNQVNYPEGEFLYLYEAPWREAAVRRLPAEVAAALDLTRRDAGSLAKYTRYLVSRLKKEGILVLEHAEMQVSEQNPLWDIQSGTGEKAVVLRGILVLNTKVLWPLLNYKLGTRSPYPVQIVSPNANADGVVHRDGPKVKPGPAEPQVGDRLVIPLDDLPGLRPKKVDHPTVAPGEAPQGEQTQESSANEVTMVAAEGQVQTESPAPSDSLPVEEQAQPAGSAPEVQLSRSDRRAGVAIADAEAVAKYGHLGLVLGEKYYTPESPLCLKGLTPGLPCRLRPRIGGDPAKAGEAPPPREIVATAPVAETPPPEAVTPPLAMAALEGSATKTEDDGDAPAAVKSIWANTPKKKVARRAFG